MTGLCPVHVASLGDLKSLEWKDFERAATGAKMAGGTKKNTNSWDVPSRFSVSGASHIGIGGAGRQPVASSNSPEGPVERRLEPRKDPGAKRSMTSFRRTPSGTGSGHAPELLRSLPA